MRKSFILIYLIICLSTLYAQKQAKTLIIGSWKEIGMSHNNIFDSIGITKSTLTFYPDGHFLNQDNYNKEYTPDYNSEMGKWRIKNNGKTLKYFNIKRTGFQLFSAKPKTFEYRQIHSINDTSLIFFDNNKEAYCQWYYIKINGGFDSYTPPDKKCAMADSGDKYLFSLVNSHDTLKKIVLSTKRIYYLNYNDSLSDTAIQEKEITLSGKIKDLDQKFITCDYTRESTVLTNKKGNSINTTIDYNYSGDFNNSVQRKVDINKMVYIEYQRPYKVGISTSGGIILAASVITSLIIAPLASIDHKNTSFNMNRYGTMLLCGLSGIVVSIPLLITGSSKLYSITRKNKVNDKDFWYIEKTKKVHSKNY